MSAGSNIIADFLEWMFFEKNLEFGTYEDVGEGMEFWPTPLSVVELMQEYSEFVNKRAESR